MSHCVIQQLLELLQMTALLKVFGLNNPEWCNQFIALHNRTITACLSIICIGQLQLHATDTICEAVCSVSDVISARRCSRGSDNLWQVKQFTLVHNSGRQQVWCAEENESSMSVLLTGGGFLMVWGGMPFHGRTHFFMASKKQDCTVPSHQSSFTGHGSNLHPAIPTVLLWWTVFYSSGKFSSLTGHHIQLMWLPLSTSGTPHSGLPATGSTMAQQMVAIHMCTVSECTDSF